MRPSNNAFSTFTPIAYYRRELLRATHVSPGDLHASAFHDLQCLEACGRYPAASRFSAVLPPVRYSHFFFFFESTLVPRLPPLRVDSQDYGPIVDYARSGSSQFQWLLPANRNINAKWITRLSFPFLRPNVAYYSLCLCPSISFSFLILSFSRYEGHPVAMSTGILLWYARNGRMG